MLQVNLDGSGAGKGKKHKAVGIVCDKELENPIQYAGDFLRKHKAAKIVVVVDTHCLPDGRLIYKGEDADSYEAFYMEQVGIHTIEANPMLSSTRSFVVAFQPQYCNSCLLTRSTGNTSTKALS